MSDILNCLRNLSISCIEVIETETEGSILFKTGIRTPIKSIIVAMNKNLTFFKAKIISDCILFTFKKDEYTKVCKVLKKELDINY